MKSYNQIVFKGILGRDARVNTVGNRKVGNFSVATEYASKQKDGTMTIETTWLNVCAWEGFGVCNVEGLKKGTRVSGSGRLRNRKYTDNSGVDHEIPEIVVDNLDIIAEETPQKPSRNENYQSPRGNYQDSSDEPF